MNLNRTYLSVAIFILGSLFGTLIGFWSTLILVFALVCLKLATQAKNSEQSSEQAVA